MKFSLLSVVLIAMTASAMVVPITSPQSQQDVENSEVEYDISTINDVEDTSPVSKRHSMSHIICKAGSSGPGSTIAFAEGIEYIESWGDAVFVAESGKCKRLSCSWDSAIWLCNDQGSQLQVPAKELAPYAQKVVDECYWVPWGDPQAQGQIFSDSNWNVVLGKDKC